MLEQILKYGVVGYDMAVQLANLFEEQDKELETVFYWGLVTKSTQQLLNDFGIDVDGVVLAIKMKAPVGEQKYIALTEDNHFPLTIEDYEALYPAPTVQELSQHLPPLIVTENGIPKGLVLNHASGPISDTSPRLSYGMTAATSVLSVEVVRGCIADAYGLMYCKLARCAVLHPNKEEQERILTSILETYKDEVPF